MVTENQFQNMTEVQRNDFLTSLPKFDDFLNGTLGTWKTDPVYL